MTTTPSRPRSGASGGAGSYRRVPRLMRRAAGLVAGWPLWVQTLVVFGLLRAVSAVLLHLAAGQQDFVPQPVYPDGPGAMTADPDHASLTLNWDAQWYERIAEHGYPDRLPVAADGEVQQNEWAFYPVFPYAVRLATSLTGMGFSTLAPALALLAGFAAAVVMAHLLRDTLPGRPTGPALGAVAVWAAFPSAPVLQMAYTESFAMLLLTIYLSCVVRRRWWAAGLTALLLGLTRPIALPLSVVVLASAWLRWRQGRPPAREAAGLGFAVVATGVSGLLWSAVVWWGTGQRDGYAATMSSWRGTHAISVWAPWARTIKGAWGYLHGDYACHFSGCERVYVVPALSIVLALAVALLALVPGVAPGLDIRLRIWSAAYAVYLLAVVDGGTSIVRYLLPLFPLAVVAVGAHRPFWSARLSRHWQLRTWFWVAAGVVGQIGWIWWLVVFSPLPGGGDYPP